MNLESQRISTAGNRQSKRQSTVKDNARSRKRTAVLLSKDVCKQFLLAFTLNTCCGCVGSFGCFYKNQSKTKFIFDEVGLWPQFCSEKQIITRYA